MDPMIGSCGRASTGLLLALAAIVLLVGVRACAARAAWKERAPATELQLLNGLSAEYVITPAHVSELPGPLGDEFGVTDAGNILIRAGVDLVEAEPDGSHLVIDRVSKAGEAPASFALDHGTVLTIRDRYFGQLEEGIPTQALPLPTTGMKLAASRLRGVVYLFAGESTSRRAYAFKENGNFSILVDLPAPIVAIADSLGGIYVATEREVLRMQGEKIDLVMRRPEDEGAIVSLAVSDDDQTVFYSTAAEVYALHGAVSVAIVKNAGGTLCWREDGLYVWDRPRGLLVKLSGLSAALYPR